MDGKVAMKSALAHQKFPPQILSISLGGAMFVIQWHPTDS